MKKNDTAKFRFAEATPTNSKGKNSRENHGKEVQKIWVKTYVVVEQELRYHNRVKKNDMG